MTELEDRLRSAAEEAERQRLLALQSASEQLHAECEDLYPYLEKFKIRELLADLGNILWFGGGQLDLLEGRGVGYLDTEVLYVAYRLGTIDLVERVGWDSLGMPFRPPTPYKYKRFEKPNLVVGVASQQQDEYKTGKRRVDLFIRHDSIGLKPLKDFHTGHDINGNNGVDTRIHISDWEFGRQHISSDDRVTEQLLGGLVRQRDFMERTNPWKMLVGRGIVVKGSY
jgi:hypothetical protein